VSDFNVFSLVCYCAKCPKETGSRLYRILNFFTFSISRIYVSL